MSIERAKQLLDYIYSRPENLEAAAQWLAKNVPIEDPRGGPELAIGKLVAGFSGPQAHLGGSGGSQGQNNLTNVASLANAFSGSGGGGTATSSLAPVGGWGAALAGPSSGLSSGVMPTNFFNI